MLYEKIKEETERESETESVRAKQKIGNENKKKVENCISLLHINSLISKSIKRTTL